MVDFSAVVVEICDKKCHVKIMVSKIGLNTLELTQFNPLVQSLGRWLLDNKWVVDDSSACNQSTLVKHF